MDPPVNKTKLSQAQCTDPVLKPIIDYLMISDTPPPASGIWRTFPHKCFKQLWSQLCLHDSVLCRKRQTTITDPKYVIVIPQSFQKEFLTIAHDNSGHQGSDRTLIQSYQILLIGLAWQEMSTTTVVTVSSAKFQRHQSTSQPLYNQSSLQDHGKW